MLLQTNSYIVPKEKRVEHQRLLRRFRQVLGRLGCEHFEAYEQVGPNWGHDTSGRFVQIMRFRDRQQQQSVHEAEQNDPAAQAVIAEFCELINFPYQQQQGLFAVGYYNGVLPVAPMRSELSDSPPLPTGFSASWPAAGTGMAAAGLVASSAEEALPPDDAEEWSEEDALDEASVEGEGAEDDEETAEAEADEDLEALEADDAVEGDPEAEGERVAEEGEWDDEAVAEEEEPEEAALDDLGESEEEEASEDQLGELEEEESAEGELSEEADEIEDVVEDATEDDADGEEDSSETDLLGEDEASEEALEEGDILGEDDETSLTAEEELPETEDELGLSDEELHADEEEADEDEWIGLTREPAPADALSPGAALGGASNGLPRDDAEAGEDVLAEGESLPGEEDAEDSFSELLSPEEPASAQTFPSLGAWAGNSGGPAVVDGADDSRAIAPRADALRSAPAGDSSLPPASGEIEGDDDVSEIDIFGDDDELALTADPVSPGPHEDAFLIRGEAGEQGSRLSLEGDADLQEGDLALPHAGGSAANPPEAAAEGDAGTGSPDPEWLNLPVADAGELGGGPDEEGLLDLGDWALPPSDGAEAEPLPSTLPPLDDIRAAGDADEMTEDDLRASPSAADNLIPTSSVETPTDGLDLDEPEFSDDGDWTFQPLATAGHEEADDSESPTASLPASTAEAAERPPAFDAAVPIEAGEEADEAAIDVEENPPSASLREASTPTGDPASPTRTGDNELDALFAELDNSLPRGTTPADAFGDDEIEQALQEAFNEMSAKKGNVPPPSHA